MLTKEKQHKVAPHFKLTSAHSNNVFNYILIQHHIDIQQDSYGKLVPSNLINPRSSLLMSHVPAAFHIQLLCALRTILHFVSFIRS